MTRPFTQHITDDTLFIATDRRIICARDLPDNTPVRIAVPSTDDFVFCKYYATYENKEARCATCPKNTGTCQYENVLYDRGDEYHKVDGVIKLRVIVPNTVRDAISYMRHGVGIRVKYRDSEAFKTLLKNKCIRIRVERERGYVVILPDN